MELVNTMKYDELTLMQFADGELDESLTAEIEEARLHDKELQSYLEVYETTRSALLSVHENEEIPAHINNLIDNFVPEKKQNRLTRLVKKNPYKTSIFSAILASIITLQGAIGILTGATIIPNQLARGVNIGPDNNALLMNVNNVNNEVFQAAKSESGTSSASLIPANASAFDSSWKCNSGYIKIDNRCIIKSSFLEEIDRQILKALANNPAINEVVIQLGDKNIILKILAD